MLVADRMVGIGFIQAEPEIKKVLRLHRDWWVMVAGDDISPVFDILAKSKKHLPSDDAPVSVECVIKALDQEWKRRRTLHALLAGDGP